MVQGEFTPYFSFLPSHLIFPVAVLDWALIFSGSEFSKHVVRDATGGWRVEKVPQRRRSAPDAREGAGDARLQRNREIPSGFRRELGQRPAPRRPWPVVEPAHDALPGKAISATERWSQAMPVKGSKWQIIDLPWSTTPHQEKDILCRSFPQLPFLGYRLL